MFEKYVLPEYQARTAILRAGGKYSFAHWDGNTKAILKYAKETGLNGIEAITPKPQGDVTMMFMPPMGSTMAKSPVGYEDIQPVERTIRADPTDTAATTCSGTSAAIRASPA